MSFSSGGNLAVLSFMAISSRVEQSGVLSWSVFKPERYAINCTFGNSTWPMHRNPSPQSLPLRVALGSKIDDVRPDVGSALGDCAVVSLLQRHVEYKERVYRGSICRGARNVCARCRGGGG
jgi:hypothetical protein